MESALKKGDGVVIHGMQTVAYNGMYGTLLGPPKDGRCAVRVKRFDAGGLRDAKIKLENLELLYTPPARAAYPADLEISARDYLQVRPWDRLTAKHVVEFAFGDTRGFAVSVGSTDPRRGCPPRMAATRTFAEQLRHRAGQGISAETVTCGFSSDGSVCEDVCLGMGSAFFSNYHDACAGLGEARVSLLVGGLRAITSFVRVAQRTSTPEPTVRSSSIGDFFNTMGADDRISPPVIFRYPANDGNEAGLPCTICDTLIDYGALQRCPRCGVPLCSSSGACAAEHDATQCAVLSNELKLEAAVRDFGGLAVGAQTANRCSTLSGFLRRTELYGKNWWSQLCRPYDQAGSYQSPRAVAEGMAPLDASLVPSDRLRTDLCPDALERGAFGFVRNWSAWCVYRELPRTTPAPLLLHNALTVFEAIRLALSDSPAITSDELLIHLVGVENEATDLGLFSELAALLPHHQALRLQLLGPGVPAARDGYRLELQRATGAGAPASAELLHCAEYGEYVASDSRYSRPDLIVGLNAGLSSPHPHFAHLGIPPWPNAILRTIDALVPAIFTDYMQHSCRLPLVQYADLVRERGGSIIEPRINPFRQPYSKLEDRLTFSNGFIFGWRFPDPVAARPVES